MPFSRPTLGALMRDTQAAIAAQLPGADATLRRSNLGVIARVLSGLVHQVYGFLDWMFRQLLPDTAQGEYLDRWGRIYNLARKGAVQAGGNVVLTGITGTVLEAGARLLRSDGASFLTIGTATLAGGTATVAATAEAGGVESNTDAGTVLSLETAVPGLDGSAAVASGGLSGGAALEDDEAFRTRLLLRIQQPPQGGARADYIGWALAQEGITRAWVYPLARGAGTVDLAFVMDDRTDIIPLSGDVAAVQAALDVLRPVTADLLVYSPTADALAVTITGLSNNTAAIRTAIAAELADQIRRDAAPGGTIYRSRLVEAVSRATGELHHTMTVPSGDVTHAAGHIAIPGTVTIS